MGSAGISHGISYGLVLEFHLSANNGSEEISSSLSGPVHTQAIVWGYKVSGGQWHGRKRQVLPSCASSTAKWDPRWASEGLPVHRALDPPEMSQEVPPLLPWALPLPLCFALVPATKLTVITRIDERNETFGVLNVSTGLRFISPTTWPHLMNQKLESACWEGYWSSVWRSCLLPATAICFYHWSTFHSEILK